MSGEYNIDEDDQRQGHSPSGVVRLIIYFDRIVKVHGRVLGIAGCFVLVFKKKASKGACRCWLSSSVK